MRNIDENHDHPRLRAAHRRLRQPAACKEMLTSLVTHLHDFARDVKLTEAEWMAGIQFLTAHRAHVHGPAAGVHPAVRHAGPVDADHRAEPRQATGLRPRRRWSGRFTPTTRRTWRWVPTSHAARRARRSMST